MRCSNNTLLLFVGSDQPYVVISLEWFSRECCQVLEDSRGGIISSFIGIKFIVIVQSELLLFLLSSCYMSFDTHCGTYYKIIFLTNNGW